MGRTLSYTLTKLEPFTSTDIINIGKVNRKYNTLQKDVWTCDSFFMPPKGMDIYALSMSGKSVVLGNEYNAQLILEACLEISELIPDSHVFLEDAGRYLLVPLILKEGGITPIIADKLAYLCLNTELSLNSHQSLSEIFTMLECIEDTDIVAQVKDLKQLVFNLNLSALPIFTIKDLINNIPILADASIVTRPVNKSDFYAYSIEPANILGGFYGEYWNLVDKDVEFESYSSLSRIQSALVERNISPILKFGVRQ